MNECAQANGGCDHNCFNFEGGFECSCNVGFDLVSNGRTCEDINECLSSPCSHNCVNTPGNYSCDCNGGYSLSADGMSCTGMTEMLIFRY